MPSFFLESNKNLLHKAPEETRIVLLTTKMLSSNRCEMYFQAQISRSILFGSPLLKQA